MFNTVIRVAGVAVIGGLVLYAGHELWENRVTSDPEMATSRIAQEAATSPTRPAGFDVGQPGATVAVEENDALAPPPAAITDEDREMNARLAQLGDEAQANAVAAADAAGMDETADPVTADTGAATVADGDTDTADRPAVATASVADAPVVPVADRPGMTRNPAQPGKNMTRNAAKVAKPDTTQYFTENTPGADFNPCIKADGTPYTGPGTAVNPFAPVNPCLPKATTASVNDAFPTTYAPCLLPDGSSYVGPGTAANPVFGGGLLPVGGPTTRPMLSTVNDVPGLCLSPNAASRCLERIDLNGAANDGTGSSELSQCLARTSTNAASTRATVTAASLRRETRSCLSEAGVATTQLTGANGAPSALDRCLTNASREAVRTGSTITNAGSADATVSTLERETAACLREAGVDAPAIDRCVPDAASRAGQLGRATSARQMESGLESCFGSASNVSLTETNKSYLERCLFAESASATQSGVGAGTDPAYCFAVANDSFDQPNAPNYVPTNVPPTTTGYGGPGNPCLPTQTTQNRVPPTDFGPPPTINPPPDVPTPGYAFIR